MVRKRGSSLAYPFPDGFGLWCQGIAAFLNSTCWPKVMQRDGPMTGVSLSFEEEPWLAQLRGRTGIDAFETKQRLIFLKKSYIKNSVHRAGLTYIDVICLNLVK